MGEALTLRKFLSHLLKRHYRKRPIKQANGIKDLFPMGSCFQRMTSCLHCWNELIVFRRLHFFRSYGTSFQGLLKMFKYLKFRKKKKKRAQNLNPKIITNISNYICSMKISDVNMSEINLNFNYFAGFFFLFKFLLSSTIAKYKKEENWRYSLKGKQKNE